MKTMSDDLFQRPKKEEDDMSSGTSQNTQKINEMDLFGDVEKREHSTEPEKSTMPLAWMTIYLPYLAMKRVVTMRQKPKLRKKPTPVG